MTSSENHYLDAETEILTVRGFLGIDEIKHDDLIAGWKTNGQVVYSQPVHIVRRARNSSEKMISFGDGKTAHIRLAASCLLLVKFGASRLKTRVVVANSLVGVVCSIPAFVESMPNVTHVETPRRKQGKSRQIVVTSYNYRKRGFTPEQAKSLAVAQVERLLAMKYKNPHELTIPECNLIGFWLGDGTKSCSRIALSQSHAYPDIVKWVDNLLQQCGIVHSRAEKAPASKSKNRSVVWTLARGTGGFGQEVEKGYFNLEPYFEKNGTELFRYFSRTQLEALLFGFWLADGNHHGKESRRYVAGTQMQLYWVLQSVCLVRGISALVSKPIMPRHPKHKTQWRFSWGGRKNWTYLKDAIQIENQWMSERVWGVTFRTSAFLLCRRRGRPFIVCNMTNLHSDSAADASAML